MCSNYDYDEYEIKVKYVVKSETHDGYCSDPVDISTRKNIIVQRRPLCTCFHQDCLVAGNKLNMNDASVRHMLEQHYDIDVNPCDRGSGYCGCVTTYKIKSAYVVVPKRAIRLLEDVS